MISNEALRRWEKTCLTSTETVKDAENYGRPVTVTIQTNVSKARDGLSRMFDIAKAVESCWHIANAGSFYSKAYFKYDIFLPDGYRSY